MASFSLTASQTFPEGTSVSVYPREARQPGGGAPSGAAVTSATVTSGVATFTGLTLGKAYTAYALVSSEHRYQDFQVSKADVAVKRETASGVLVVEATVDLPSINANTTTDVNVALPSGTCKAGDLVDGVFLPALNHGLIVQGAGVVTADSIRLRVSNVTAGALDAAAVSVTFAIIRTQ